MARDESKLNTPALEGADTPIAPPRRREGVDLATATPEEIRADIDRVRSEMDRTLDRLTTRVQPRHLLDDVLDMFQRGNTGEDEGRARRTLREAGAVAADKVKSNPMPATLIGAGLAWLLFQDNGSRRSTSVRSTTGGGVGYDPYTGSEFAGAGVEVEGVSVSNAAHAIQAKAADMSKDAHKIASEMAHKAKVGVWTGEERVKGWIESSPLAMGVAALAAGLMTGLVLPGTQREDELMGEASDRLKTQAQQAGEAAMETGQEIAASGVSAPRDADVVMGPGVETNLERLADTAFDSMRSELQR